ncbi:hypothetical protein Pyn_35729 [Prunus yedoensis var. nudiflora]|uniref:Uncharacterized protein n=1 Tax=Prunus yedoensis var. nudiflora TaxID=2094558 RepID=A0A314USP9_PRUYE|nr:hypothetical protein Pyn_35729 [Prunus yedoensis var. nudiflora]
MSFCSSFTFSEGDRRAKRGDCMPSWFQMTLTIPFSFFSGGGLDHLEAAAVLEEEIGIHLDSR